MTGEDFVPTNESRIDGKTIYEGRILNLRIDRVRLQNGRETTREVVEHEPAVVVIAENDASKILLIDQFRYPVDETIIELPAGIVERGEDMAIAASRELQEETGWKPSKMEMIAQLYSSPGFSNERLVLFYATGLTRSKLPEDDDESIVPYFVSREEVERLIVEGRITDGKTLLGLYWWLYRKK